MSGRLTPEGEAAYDQFRQEQFESDLMDIQEWPSQYSATPKWNTLDNHAAINIVADFTCYPSVELQRMESLLETDREIPVNYIIDDKGGYRLFSMWYRNHERLRQEFDEDPQSQGVRDAYRRILDEDRQKRTPEQLAQNPALVEALNELKAAGVKPPVTLEAIQKSAMQDALEENFRIVSACATQLKGIRAARVESEQYRGTVVHKQIGYHLQFHKEASHDNSGSWTVLELHILMSCTPENWQYVEPDFNAFLKSIFWVPPPGE